MSEGHEPSIPAPTTANGRPLPVGWDTLRRSRPVGEPFDWRTVSGMFPAELLATLEAEFPRGGFTLSERPDGIPGTKGYRTYNLPLVHDDAPLSDNLARLSPTWCDLVGELRSETYRSAVEQATGRDLTGCLLQIRAIRYAPGCWISPHTDRADKIATQTWYFNSGWRPDWRGELVVLNSPGMDDVADSVLPDSGESVLLCPSERSWHAVVPVAEHAAEDRRTLLAHFVAPDSSLVRQ